MSLNRQQKRAMIRRLNDKAKMSEVMEKYEEHYTKEMGVIKKKKVRSVIFTVLQWLLIASIITYFVLS
jgi:hypothetical protein